MSRASRLRVLVVDDHAVVQWGFKVLLGSQRWVERCVVASNPEEALEAAARHEARRRPRRPLPRRALGRGAAARRSASASPETRVLLISGVGWISPQAAQDGRAPRASSPRTGAPTRSPRRCAWSAGDDGLRPPRGGARRRRSPSASARCSTLIATGATNQEIAERLYLSPAHGQGARELALPQARRQEPRRGGAARRAPRPDRAEQPRAHPPNRTPPHPPVGGLRAVMALTRRHSRAK